VSLWKGTTVSHGSAGGERGIDEHGQASPRDIPSILVRVEGQIVERPSTRTAQTVGRGTTGTEEACVEG